MSLDYKYFKYKCKKEKSTKMRASLSFLTLKHCGMCMAEKLMSR